VSDDVMIAVDPHKASNTAAVLDPVTKTAIEAARRLDVGRRWSRPGMSPWSSSPR
jgi:hypothetical protein